MAMSDIIPTLGVEEAKDWKKLLKALAAEFIGTMFLVILACGACINSNGDVVRISLAFGLTVATMAQSIGHISGCHINPAVTAGLIVGRKIGIISGILYVVVQCVGAIVGAGILKAITGDAGIGNVGAMVKAGTLSPGQGFGQEFLISFGLVLVVYAAACDEINAANVKGSAPLAIGLAIAIGHLFSADKTGAGMNPARSLGTSVITGDFQAGHHWIYWVGPILGGIAAGLVYQMLFQAPEPTRQEASGSKGEYTLAEVKDQA